MEIEKRLVKNRSLKKRITTTMVVSILIPFMLLTLILILMLISNIDEFIDDGHSQLEVLKLPIIVSSFLLRWELFS